MTTKTCQICGVTKEITDFYKRGCSFSNRCKTCEIQSGTLSYRVKQKQKEQQLSRLDEDGFRKGFVTPACSTSLKRHHSDLEKDPEHLSTEFIIKLTGCKCKRKVDK